MSGGVALAEKRDVRENVFISMSVIEHMRDCVGFFEGINEGLGDYRRGNLKSWLEVKKELGYE